MSTFSNQKSSLCPTNGCQTVGDGAAFYDNEPAVLAVCQLEGNDDLYYYSTTFAGGPGKNAPQMGGSPASSFSSLSSSRTFQHPLTASSSPVSHPSVPCIQTLPQVIPRKSNTEASTPPLTPDDDSDPEDGMVHSESEDPKDALNFLVSLFPQNGPSVLSYAKSVTISTPGMDAVFEGVIMEIPNQPKTLYVDAKEVENVSLRDSIVALLDLADEVLHCEALIIVLERLSPNLGDMLHSLMYVGGTVVTRPVFALNPAFVLVGLTI
ncbi:hypothetical protein BDN72DRAFT_867992 [Pluteus cervinus]|uniref:Uncharacterized protein n=1 Tax=Pluteus cervinus TaxID=181527 RepID=A0ACD3BC88_9AGAR|nr:hypothetical protein BDN72DRAFT_867992 [Pluteus cervinus]